MVHNKNIKQVHCSFGLGTLGTSGWGHLSSPAGYVQVLDIYVDTFESVSDFPSILTEKDEAPEASQVTQETRKRLLKAEFAGLVQAQLQKHQAVVRHSEAQKRLRGSKPDTAPDLRPGSSLKAIGRRRDLRQSATESRTKSRV